MTAIAELRRPLGRSGLKVAPLAFGGNVFGWTVNEQDAFAILDAFLEAGFNLIDTADSYSRWVAGNQGGESETIIGNWLRRHRVRDRVVIATKVASETGPGEKGLSRAYILRAVERSLRRLDTEYIDLYQSHRDDPDTPIEETLEAYGQLMREGKVRAIGASNFSAGRLAESLAISSASGLPRYESLQPCYNLYERSQFEGELADLCRRENIGVISYFSLASGFLTGKYRVAADSGKSPRGARVTGMLNPRGLRILGALDTVAAELRATPAQVSLAWLMARGVTAPIASATSLPQLHELLGAAHLRLGTEALTLLDAASAPA
ncbi:MAG TPA: aldo/keto reductase [Steroidobacteraceae bacterium]|nr:aldo/keto reductase [Steroidobacteraceae bacterium]